MPSPFTLSYARCAEETAAHAVHSRIKCTTIADGCSIPKICHTMLSLPAFSSVWVAAMGSFSEGYASWIDIREKHAVAGRTCWVIAL